MPKYVVEKQLGELRLDRWMRKKFPDIPLSHLHRMLRQGKVLVDGKKAKGKERVSPGDEVSLPLEMKEREPRPRRVDKYELEILYEDEEILVINKKSGIAVQAMSKVSKISLLDHLEAYFQDKGYKGHPHLVHRLDLNTSGVLVIAKTPKAAGYLSKLFRERKVKKEYVALVHGKFDQKEGEILLPLEKRKGDIHRPKVSKGSDHDYAETGYKVLKYKDGVSYVVLTPKTGRMHQLRVHLSASKHYILGDPRYGERKLDKRIFGKKVPKRQFLHARKLSFKHPGNGEEITFEAVVPKLFESLLKDLGIKI